MKTNDIKKMSLNQFENDIEKTKEITLSKAIKFRGLFDCSVMLKYDVENCEFNKVVLTALEDDSIMQSDLFEGIVPEEIYNMEDEDIINYIRINTGNYFNEV